MSIPASVKLYANWGNGVLASGTYTAATPDVPNAHTYVFTADESIAADADPPWNGQEVLILDADPTITFGNSTTSSATISTSAGRVMMEFERLNTAVGRTIASWYAVSHFDGRVRVRIEPGGNLEVQLYWQGGQFVDVSLGAAPGLNVASVIEVIYDSNNGTAANRLRARTWALGGSPPSFTDTADGSTAGATNEFVNLLLGDDEDNMPVQFGRIAFSNSIAEDLSNLDEGSAAVILLGQASL